MSSKERDTITYELKAGGETVYIGTTNDPEERERQHRADGKTFDRLVPTSQKMTPEEAKRKESQDLEKYRRGHNGKNPKYNKDDDG